MSIVSMKKLLEAGVHFGHQTRRWNPKMKKFIFTERNGIYIIDLAKTANQIEKAYETIRDIASEGGTDLFVGTKKQAQDSIEQEAKRCAQYYVSNRWLGGILTNFNTIRNSVNKLKKYETQEEMEQISSWGVEMIQGYYFSKPLPEKELLELLKKQDNIER